MNVKMSREGCRCLIFLRVMLVYNDMLSVGPSALTTTCALRCASISDMDDRRSAITHCTTVIALQIFFLCRTKSQLMLSICP